MSTVGCICSGHAVHTCSARYMQEVVSSGTMTPTSFTRSLATVKLPPITSAATLSTGALALKLT